MTTGSISPAMSAVVPAEGAISGPQGGAKDTKESTTAPKFGEVWDQIQSKYGAKPDKPREIKKTLGKDDFLKIMITQMKHQDPTNPFKAEQFATQLAQFSSVEQLQNINQSVNKLAANGQPMERLAMTNLIGKSVTVDHERFPHTADQNESLTFALPKDAAQTKITIMADNGETIFAKDLGPQKQGEGSFAWDGKQANNLPAKSGNYVFRIEAKDENDRTIALNPQARTQVVGVSFEGSEPVFLVGNPNKPDKITFRNIVRIETDQPSIPGAKSFSESPTAINPQGGPGVGQAGGPPTQSANGDPTKATAAQGKAFFTYTKGVGSETLSGGAKGLAQGSAPPPQNVAANSPATEGKGAAPSSAGMANGVPETGANAANAASAANAAAKAAEKADGEKGFPNGLSN